MEFLILILFFLAFLFFGLYKSKIKGVIGEKSISSILYFLDKSKYKVINDIVLKKGTKTSQIDHIVISDFGIFVIETKNYKGWIVGNENSEYWTQVLFKRKERIYNPIKQNLGHINALKNCLSSYSNINYIPIVVFLTKSEIKVNSTTDVINSHQLIATIKKYYEINLTETQKEEIFQKIKDANVVGTYDKNKHVKSIKKLVQKRKTFIQENKCPECGGNLVLRSGKFGEFLGCISYPRCKFIRNI
nr:NERD domain-containing protein [uncultured Flavobacterium sp.]